VCPDALSKRWAIGIAESFIELLDSVSFITTLLPVVDLLPSHRAHMIRSAVIDEYQQLIGCVDLIRQVIGLRKISVVRCQ